MQRALDRAHLTRGWVTLRSSGLLWAAAPGPPLTCWPLLGRDEAHSAQVACVLKSLPQEAGMFSLGPQSRRCSVHGASGTGDERSRRHHRLGAHQAASWSRLLPMSCPGGCPQPGPSLSPWEVAGRRALRRARHRTHSSPVLLRSRWQCRGASRQARPITPWRCWWQSVRVCGGAGGPVAKGEVASSHIPLQCQVGNTQGRDSLHTRRA